MLNNYLFKKKFKKNLLIMGISLFICLAFMVSVFAEDTYSQTTKYYSVTLKNTTIRQAISEIERQSDYAFLIKGKVDAELDRIVNLSIGEKELSEILESLFSGTNLLYMISGWQVFVSKSESELEEVRQQVLQKEEPEVEQTVVQGIRVTGTVSDMNGDPLPGASIVVKGTGTGTVTDADGQYAITVPDENAVLQFSFVGYALQEFMVGDQTTMNVTLMETAAELEEVIVVGYGAQRKVSVTGAISTVQTKELRQSSSANLSTALAGRLPGLTALQTSGQPGHDLVNLYLRGTGTINGADPLIMIDGIPRTDISTLDPNEIASISILKDASATAVFGVRGANGVILINTRRGTEGKPELSVTVDQSWQKFLVRADRLHSWEFAELRNQAARNNGLTIEPFSPYMIQKYRDGSDRVFYPDRDVFHEYFNDWSPQTRVNVNLSGGNKDMKYFLNVGYVGQGGNVKTEPESYLGYDPGFRMDRYSFRANVDYNVTKRLKMSLNLASYIEKMNSPQSFLLYSDNFDFMIAQILRNVWYTPPTDPGPKTVAGYTTPDGEEIPVNQILTQSGTTGSPFGTLNRFGYRQETKSLLNSSINLDYALDFVTPGLSTKLLVAFDTKGRTILQGIRTHDTYSARVARTADEQCEYVILQNNTAEAIALQPKIMQSYYYLNVQYSLNYARKFGLHDVGAMALFQRDNWESQNYSAQLPYNMVGLVGRVTYGYDDRYLAEVNVGYNGSEQFAPANRFGLFPAVSLGWVANNEAFLKDNPVLTNLKLRFSFGKVGNDKMGDERFLYNSVITESGNGWAPSLGRQHMIYQGMMGNEHIQWEVAIKQNYGLDIQLFKSLSLSADVFFEKRDKILITRGTVPELQGVELYNIPKMNMGKVDNQGYELELNYFKSINQDLSFTLRANYAYNRNTQVFVDEPRLSEDYAYPYRSTGYSIGQPFGYQIDYSNGNGYINTPAELSSLPSYAVGGVPRLGDFIYVDQNNDGVINDRDLVPIGYPYIPRITYGFSGSLNFRNLDFSFLFTGIAQSNVFSFGCEEYDLAGFYSDWHLKAWTAERYASGEEILYPALSYSAGTSQNPNDHFILDKTFLRLKNIELGYNFPQNWLKPIGISRVRAYVNGNNLWTWKKLPLNLIDPEQMSPVNQVTYPLTRMFNFGLNVVF